MHSRKYLRGQHFRFIYGDSESSFTEIAPQWSPEDRVVIVAPDPAQDLVATAGLVLALTHAFYDRPVVREAGFFDYPSHFVIGGEQDAQPHILGPGDKRPWSAAWCRLDVWPSTHHVISDPAPETLMQAVLMLEPTRLIWPERLPWPAHYENPAGPSDEITRTFLHSRIRQVICYEQAEQNDTAAVWSSVQLTGSSHELLSEAIALLPDQDGKSLHDASAAVFRSLPLEACI